MYIGVGTVVLDSFLEIVRLDDIARRHGAVQPVLIRATVGVEAPSPTSLPAVAPSLRSATCSVAPPPVTATS